MIKEGDKFHKPGDPKNVWVVTSILPAAEIVYIQNGWLSSAVHKDELLDTNLWLKVESSPVSSWFKCECGAEKTGIPWHYQWCPMDGMVDNFDDEEFII